MNYYKRHIGDYASDTGHLTALEHGIYTLLLDWYYKNEKPIPEDRASRIAKCQPDEVAPVLKDFFKLTAAGWKHGRAERVIAESREKAEKNRESGKLGGRPRKNHDGFEKEPTGTLATSHKPLASKEHSTSNEVLTTSGEVDQESLPKVKRSKADGVPYRDIVELYHAKLPMLPKCEKLTPGRRGGINARWREDLPTLDAWGNFFEDIGKSRFLTGRAPPRTPDAAPFRATIGWVCKPENFAKILEGFYHR